jgi:hypothetical protein
LSISGWNVIKVNGSPTSTFRVLLERQESSSILNPKDSDENQPSVEAIQEFTAQGSNLAPEFGQVAGCGGHHEWQRAGSATQS